MTLPRLTESTIRASASPASFARGKEYFLNGAISNATIQGNTLSADCAGTSAPYYRVRVELDKVGIRAANCSCPYDYGGYCKHIVALLLHYIHNPHDFVVRPAPQDLLADLSREDLIAILTTLLERDPDLYDFVQGTLALSSAPHAKAKRAKKVDTEVYRRQVRNIMHSLDSMRASAAYWHVGELADQLDDLVGTARQFLEANDPETALEILFAVLEETSNHIEYLDDSDGELASFVSGLGEPLAETILSLEWSEAERARLLARLDRLGKHLGAYGLDDTMPLAIQAAQYGWNEAPPASDAAKDEEWDAAEYENDGYGSYAPRVDLTDVKLNILARQNRHDEFLSLAQQQKKYLRYVLMLCDLGRVSEAVQFAEQHLQTAAEACTLAKRLRELQHFEEALAIAERGLQLAPPKWQLGLWLGSIQESRGETARAFEAWFAAFAERPSLDIYKTLKRLAATTWDETRPQVMSALKKSNDNYVLAEVHLFEEEWDKAIEIASKHGTWSPVKAIVAEAVIEHRPEWVIELSIQEAEALIGRTQSKYYAQAAEWLARVKKAYTHLKREDAWHAFLNQLQEKYKRRPALQAHLKRL